MEHLTLTVKLKVKATDPKVGEATEALKAFGDLISVDLTTYREKKA